MIFFLLFIFSLNLKLNFFPYYLGGVLGVLGLINLIFSIKKNRINKEFFYLLFILMLIPFFYSISLIYNQTSDFYYLKTFFINNLVYLFSAFFLMQFFQKKINIFLYNEYILNLSKVVLLQLGLSLIMYVSPMFFDIIFYIIAMERDADLLKNFNDSRVVGFGISFFGAGVFYSLVLVLLADFISKNKSNFLIIVYLIIVVVGIIISRTTVIGFIFSLIIILWNYRSNVNLIGLLLLLLSMLGFTLLYFVNKDEEIKKIVEFGFSFLYDYKNSQALESLGTLFEMFNILPSKFSTWIIGDGQFGNQDIYYMNTDVGYFRIIFASGFFGLFLFFFVHLYMLVKIRSNYISNFTKIIIFVMLLILNLKGVASFFVLLVLPFLFSIYFRKTIDND